MDEGNALPRGLLTAVEGAPLPRGAPPRQDAPQRSRHRDDEPEEILFGKATRKPKKRVGGGSGGADEKKFKQEQARTEKDQAERKTSSLLTYSRLTIGMRILARVKAVTEEKAVLSLVNNLTATIPWSEASDEHFRAFESGSEAPSLLPRILPVGSLVRCVVTSTNSDEKERMLRVSCRASLLNKAGALDPAFAAMGGVVVGTIKSIEDHGAVINFGVKNLTGFIPFSSTPGGKHTLHSEGQQVEAIVVSRPSKLVANLKLSDTKSLSSEAATSFPTLQPGVLVQVKYKRNDLLDGGALFSLWSPGFVATADWLHSGEGLELLDAKDKVDARVVWVDANAKTLGVSLLPHIVQLQSPSWEHSVGEIIQGAIITKAQPRIGVLLSLPEMGFAHITKLVDGTEHPSASDLKRDFPVGNKVQCRVLDMNPLDGTYSLSLQPSVLAASVTSYDSLAPGMKVSGKVVKVDPSFGVLLELGQHIRGIVTLMHLSDSAGSETAPESRFKVGQTCKGRVLTSSNEKVSITLKKTIVGSTLSTITTYQEATPGTISHGFITKVDDFGVIVTFFGGVHGIVPAHTLGSQVSNISELYRVSVMVNIVSFKKQRSTASQG